MPRGERPLGSGDDPLVRFARELRRLRDGAGNPTYRELSVRAHYSAAALSEAAGGRKLPSLPVTLAYVAACGGDPARWEQLWHGTAAELATLRVAEPDASGHGSAPYVGLTAFQPGDADLFFGREGLVARLVGQVRLRRFLGVFGPSGCGKSSLLRAGLVAELTADRPVIVFTPGTHPMEECAVRLAAFTGQPAAVLRSEFTADPENLHLRVRQAMADRPADTDLVLVVDQFEEVFSRCADPDERTRFVDALVGAALAGSSRTRVVIGVRADFYGHCGGHAGLVEALDDAQVLVGPMTTTELRRAITTPAERVGCRVEAALVSQLIADAAGRSGVLPLVSHALLETWRRRCGTTLTLSGYEATGGIRHALAHSADAVYTRLGARQQRVARQIFLRLTAIGDGTEDTRRHIGRHELDATDPDTTVVLERLAHARLVTLDRDGVELVHEALVRHWPRLRDWLADDRDGLRVHRRLTEAAQEWDAVDRDAGALYRGTRLAGAQEWAATRDTALTRTEREFLDASVAARDAEQSAVQGRARRLRHLVALLAVLLLLASTAVGYAVRSQRTLSHQRDVAVVQKVLREAAALRHTDPALASQLTLAAHRLGPGAESRSALLGLFATPYSTRLTDELITAVDVAAGQGGRILAIASPDGDRTRLWDLRDRHRPTELPSLPGSKVTAVTFDPEGNILVTAGGAGPPRLWDVSDPAQPRELATLPGPTSPAAAGSVAFGVDGRMLAVAGADGTARLWNVTDPGDPRPAGTIGGAGTRVVFHPRDAVLVTTGGGATRLWGVTDPGAPARLAELPDAVAAAISPDGRTLATAGADGTARLWDVTGPRSPVPSAVLTGHSDAVVAIAFGQDGNTVATTSDDATVRLWNVADPRQPQRLAVLTGHGDAVLAVAFGPDGNTIATAGADRTVRLWDVAQLALAGHAGSVSSIDFAPEGHTLVTTSDRTARLWDLRDRHVPRLLAAIDAGEDLVAARFGPDGRTLVTAGVTGPVQLWDITDPRDPRRMGRLPIAAARLTFRSDGTLATTGPGDEPVRLWDLADPRDPRQVATLPFGGSWIAFSSDGRTIAATSPDGVNGTGTTQLWDITEPTRARLVTRILAVGPALAFSADDRVLAIVGPTGTTLWNLTNPRRPELTATLPDDADAGHDGPGTGAGPSVAFGSGSGSGSGFGSRSGERVLATASDDRIVRIWNAVDPRRPAELAALTSPTATVLAIAFSPDGTSVATAGEDHVVHVWDTDPDRVATRICDLAHPRITPAEWEHHFPGFGYEPPCRG